MSSTAEAAMAGDASAKTVTEGVVKDVVKPLQFANELADGVLGVGRSMMQSLETQIYGDDSDYDNYRTK